MFLYRCNATGSFSLMSWSQRVSVTDFNKSFFIVAMGIFSWQVCAASVCFPENALGAEQSSSAVLCSVVCFALLYLQLKASGRVL